MLYIDERVIWNTNVSEIGCAGEGWVHQAAVNIMNHWVP
jgi:hypothetical protein